MGYESQLRAMTNQELIDEAASLGDKIGWGFVGVVTGAATAVPTAGASLTGAAVSGATGLYYFHKSRVLKQVAAERGLKVHT